MKASLMEISHGFALPTDNDFILIKSDFGSACSALSVSSPTSPTMQQLCKEKKNILDRIISFFFLSIILKMSHD